MDDSLMKKGIQALKWEANYRKREEKADANHFLAPVTTLDVDFDQHLDKCNVSTGKVLDIGTGTGEQAIFLAQKGFEVTATDVSITALEDARKRALAHEANVTFVEDNILNTKLACSFGLIIDRGCFTILPAMYKSEYSSVVGKLLAINGWFFIKVDKKKSGSLEVFTEDKRFKTFALYESSYPCTNDKIIPAVVLITQKIQ